MNIEEMNQSFQELVDDPEKASVIFNVILQSGNPDIIQRALELYVLLILNHGEDIQKTLNEEHDRNRSYEQIIDRLEQNNTELEQENVRLERQLKNRDLYAKKEMWPDDIDKWKWFSQAGDRDWTYLDSLLEQEEKRHKK